MIVEADTRGLLTPLPGDHFGHRLSLYANDLVLFLAPKQEDFSCVRAILDLFAGALGLLTNVDKCLLSPIQCSDDQVTLVQQAFPCQVSPFPCRYLGVPLSVVKLQCSVEQQLVDAVARRILTWKAGLLNTAGRLTITRAMLSAIPVHISITCSLSAWAIKQIDKRHHAFLWCGSEVVSRGKCRVAWPVVCFPWDYGGLGLPDLCILGFALRLHLGMVEEGRRCTSVDKAPLLSRRRW